MASVAGRAGKVPSAIDMPERGIAVGCVINVFITILQSRMGASSVAITGVCAVPIFQPCARGGASRETSVRGTSRAGGRVRSVPLDKLVHLATRGIQAIGRVIGELGLETEARVLLAANYGRRQRSGSMVSWPFHELASANMFGSDLAEQRMRRRSAKLTILPEALHGLPFAHGTYEILVNHGGVRADAQNIPQLVYAGHADYGDNALIEVNCFLHLGGS